MYNERWERAQDAELHYYNFVSKKTPDLLIENFEIDRNLGTVLEVGSSPTSAIHDLWQAKERVAIDPLALQYGHDYSPSADHIAGIGEMLPFGSSSFDTVLCLNVLDHVLYPLQTLDEINRVMKADGRFLFSINVFDGPRALRKALGRVDHPHPWHFSEEEARSLLDHAGFSIIASSSLIVDLSEANFKTVIAGKIFGMRLCSFDCVLE